MCTKVCMLNYAKKYLISIKWENLKNSQNMARYEPLNCFENFPRKLAVTSWNSQNVSPRVLFRFSSAVPNITVFLHAIVLINFSFPGISLWILVAGSQLHENFSHYFLSPFLLIIPQILIFTKFQNSARLDL